MDEQQDQWWTELRQGGMLISPTVLRELLPDGPGDIDDLRYMKLRDAHTRFAAASERKDEGRPETRAWVDAVLESFLGFYGQWWQKGNNVADRFKAQAITREPLRPDRVLLWEGQERYPRMLVKLDLDSEHIGMGRGRGTYSKMLELLRGTNVPIGLLTNGRQFRLVYAGLDHDCWVEWETSRWFEDTLGNQQLAGFLSLCGPYGANKRDGKEHPLLEAIKESRTRQGELSQVLGEQTRTAVEELLAALDRSLRAEPDLLTVLTKDPVCMAEIGEETQLEALYQATIRMIMRLVVVLFAESRELLPKSSEVYHSSYGVEGLFAQLKEASNSEGTGALEERYHAWPRLLALFRLIYEGSDDPDLPVNAYGGSLFRKGDPRSEEPVLRALSLFENDRVEVSDATVLKVLRLLKVGRMRAKVGRASKMVNGVVDFSDLRTEYIGMMYEGLLDYRLRKVSEEQEAVLILNIGQQPALPFSLLRTMERDRLSDLLKQLSKEKAEKSIEDGGEEADQGSEDGGGFPEEPAVDEVLSPEEDMAEDTPQEVTGTTDLDDRVDAWAREAVELSGTVRRTKGRNIDQFKFESDRAKAAKNLVIKTIRPGQTYLVRGSGTRKGSGTFYTKPQLAVPTVMRTLEPLAYKIVEGSEGKVRRPRAPEEILSLKVCDPAMGSGSFLVAALNYLTDALYQSLEVSGRIKVRKDESAVMTLPLGSPSGGQISEEVGPCRAQDEGYEPRMKARLKRYIVERCIYGVDINPLAVELAKLSLWVETMDRELPFGFLDHKLKAGNSLVGCWFDQFQEYPLISWKREGGDKDHRGVNHARAKATNAIGDFLKTKINPEYSLIINGQKKIEFWEYQNIDKVKENSKSLVKLFEGLHNLPLTCDGQELREKYYSEKIGKNGAINSLKDRFNLWCAIWFWPTEWLDNDAPLPSNFYSPTIELMERVGSISKKIQFFHWELEFPDVFITGTGGFDAVVGNPPWETIQPMSKEFFSLYDPIFRTYGKQQANDAITTLFVNNKEIEESWIEYNSYYKSLVNYLKNSGDIVNGKNQPKEVTIAREIEIRLNRPYCYQGSGKFYTYRMFLEFAHFISNNKARVGMIVPSGIYSDEGSSDLRQLFFNKCAWEWLIVGDNRKKIFQIDSRYKFCSVIIQKGLTTKKIKATFSNHDLSDWQGVDGASVNYLISQIEHLSPLSKVILEVTNQKDLEIIDKIYENSHMVRKFIDMKIIKYHQGDYNMTSDSGIFPPVSWWKEHGYVHTEHGYWEQRLIGAENFTFHGNEIGSNGERALPLFQGIMIGQYDQNMQQYLEGAGNRTRWTEVGPNSKSIILPQFLMSSSKYVETARVRGLKLAFRSIARSSDERTMISSVVHDYPCGHSIGLFSIMNDEMGYGTTLLLLGCFNSYIYDFVIRNRLNGPFITLHVLEETPLPKIEVINSRLQLYIARLALSSIVFSDNWLTLTKAYPELKKSRFKQLFAATDLERVRIRAIVESIYAYYFNLDFEDLNWIVRQDKNNNLGFWREEKEKLPQLKRSLLTLSAYSELRRIGIDRFLELNGGEGWMIPERLKFSVREDGTINFDDPNGTEYEVASKLGPRFLDWQLEGTPEKSWKECEMHARNILGEESFEEFMRKLKEESPASAGETSLKSVLDKASKNDQKAQSNPQAKLFDFNESKGGEKI